MRRFSQEPKIKTAKGKIIVLHIITALKYGGAEMMLLKILSTTNTSKFHPVVVSLSGSGGLTSKVEELGVTVHSLKINPALPNPLKFIRLVLLIRFVRPAIVQTWMYHADFLGGLAAKLAGVKQIVWNVRNSGLDPKQTKTTTSLTVKLCSVISHFVPKRIVTNSQVAAKNHKTKGYKNAIFHIIPNGFDVSHFKASEASRLAMRNELGLEPDAILIGLIARYDPQKNHRGFLEAAAFLNKTQTGQFYLLAGRGVDSSNTALLDWIGQLGLSSSVILLGQRDDVTTIIPSLDICTLSSTYGEAFPNVIGEAMCCEVPVVTTDVGDSGYIVGDTGTIVQVDHPESLAAAWHQLLSLPDEQRRAAGKLGRERILENFNLTTITAMYEELYSELLRV